MQQNGWYDMSEIITTTAVACKTHLNAVIDLFNLLTVYNTVYTDHIFCL